MMPRRGVGPALVVLFLALGSSALAESKPSLESQDALTAQIDRLLAEAYPAEQPGVAVLVRVGDKVLLRKGYGMASLEWAIPVDPETVFSIGSLTKQFTAFAILKAVQEGKVSLEDPLTRYFPDLPAFFNSIKVEHLLTHTSGIASYPSLPDYLHWSQRDLPKEAVLQRFLQEPLDFDPGKGWVYSDSGFYLLGLILEKVYGKSYSDVMQEKIFGPVGMKHSLVDEPGRIVSHRAVGHILENGRIVKAPVVSPNVSYAAGAILSTIDDMALWDHALSHGFIPEDLLKRAFNSYRLADGRSTNYGYAWAIGKYEGHVLIEHGGRVSGCESHVLRMPDSAAVVIILGNGLGRKPGPDFLARKIASYLIGKPYAPVAVALPQEILEEYVGTYRFSETSVGKVALDGSRVLFQRNAKEPQVIFPKEKDVFFFPDSFTSLRFERDPSGKIVRLIYTPDYGVERRAEKIP
ncbi:MAG TPA: serine hydrolase [Thermoanaerobaculia bacterium]|jgi:CubicO group peptidase (beta-lactamase class C family)|nr:serine hydrolase [Thermoanaerobaculia bacterium]